MSKLIQHKFSDLYEMSSGISSKPEQAGHGTPFVSFKTVFNNHFLPDQLSDLMNTSEEEQRIFSVKVGDIFLTRTSETLDELGMSAVANKDYPQATFSGFLKRLRPIKSGLSYHKYMAFYLRSEQFRKIMNNNAIMTLRASLNEQIFSYLNLLLLPFEEQKLVGDLLFSIYQKIELNNRINTELEKMAKAIYDYWFVQFDFPNANGKPYTSSGGKMVYNEVLRREIPKGWEVQSLYNVADFINGLACQKYRPENDADDFLPVIKIREMGEGISANTEKARVNIPDKNKIDDGDVLFSWSATLDVKIWTGGKGALNQHIFKVISKEYPRSFYYFEILNYLHHFKMMAELRKTTMGHITIDHLKTSFISVPPKFLIERLDQKLEPIFLKIVTNQKQNQELSQLRDWLLPMMMNGQVKIMDVMKEYNAAEEQMALAAEPLITYEAPPKLNIPDNRKYYAKQVLAGKIVSEFKDDPNFTDIKLQKIQFLAEHIIEADLKLNYYCQVAGPYDNVFMHTIYNDFRKQKWFDCKNKQILPLEKQGKIEEYYQGYFAPAQEQLNKLFELLYQTTEAEAEIIATLYAVWNNRIIEKRPVIDEELIQEFYQWSDRKQQYSEEQVIEGLQWLRIHQMEPKGFGKLIKKAKGKK